MDRYFASLDGETVGLTRDFRVNPISCNNCSYYENYIKYCATTDNNDGKTTTQLFLEKDEKEKEHLLGFISLRATSLLMIDGNCQIGYSAIEISELAVSDGYERQGIGKTLIDYSVMVADKLNTEYVGVQYIVLCSDPLAKDFYLKMGFDELREYFKLPRESWNKNCVPLILKLH